MKNLPKTRTCKSAVSTSHEHDETPKTIADRIRQVIKHVPADRVYPSTDCGMKPLARMVAKMKLGNLAKPPPSFAKKWADNNSPNNIKNSSWRIRG